ncbi:MAG TPA: DUF1844 domain-containing protein [Bdellovibrionota bacterium]|nr:DUF1844 domain-containing protein [Bdellovibrionota bacterium]
MIKEEKQSTTQSQGAPFIIDFSTFLVSIGSAALIGMGLAKNPSTGLFEKNLESAKQHIELLTLLKEKTKGNLTKEETQLLDALLYDTRMRYVEVAQEPASKPSST